MRCELCPRRCNVDRRESVGYCNSPDDMRVAKVMLHKYEEPIISGDEKSAGSGAIFFTGCNMRCLFCQNYPISRGGVGERVSVERLVEIVKDLERQGANNINLVTPTHYADKIVQALKIYKPKIPIVWNSNGYETTEMVDMISQYVDIYLVDLKYFDDTLAMRYSGARDYFATASRVIKRMRVYQPKDIVENGLMKKGMIVRHLILPTHTSDSIKCLDFIAKELGSDTIVSLMSQYEPRYDAYRYPEINRKITALEYKRVVSHAIELNLHKAYTQDLSSADSKYTPKF